MNPEEIKRQKIILFDGVCNLCTRSVIFVLKHEKKKLHRFASIQSEIGQELLKWCGLPAQYDQTVIYLENGITHLGSTAALKIGQNLAFPWSFLSYAGIVVPKPIREWVYFKIARNRYQWFGKKDICMVPNEDIKSRFL
jgi:predicted DCC family thiol-disulfide oxidoreductase YuxK